MNKRRIRASLLVLLLSGVAQAHTILKDAVAAKISADNSYNTNVDYKRYIFRSNVAVDFNKYIRTGLHKASCKRTECVYQQQAYVCRSQLLFPVTTN